MIKRKRKTYSYKKRPRRAVKLSVNMRPGEASFKLVKTVLKLIFIACIACGLYYATLMLYDWACQSPRFVIKDISVSGGKNVTRTEIKKLLPFAEGDNLVKVDLRSARREIKNLKSELKNISMSRRWQKIHIKLYERSPEAFIKEAGELKGVDFDNTPFPLRGFMSEYPVPELIYSDLPERNALLGFLRSLKNVSPSFAESVLSISLGRAGDVIMIMRDNTVIMWGDVNFDNIGHKVKITKDVYAHALSKHGAVQYINMHFYEDGRAIVMPATAAT